MMSAIPRMRAARSGDRARRAFRVPAARLRLPRPCVRAADRYSLRGAAHLHAARRPAAADDAHARRARCRPRRAGAAELLWRRQPPPCSASWRAPCRVRGVAVLGRRRGRSRARPEAACGGRARGAAQHRRPHRRQGRPAARQRQSSPASDRALRLAYRVPDACRRVSRPRPHARRFSGRRACSATSATCAPGNGIEDPGFQALLRLMKAGKAWVKLTGPYRISPGAMPHADTDAFAHRWWRRTRRGGVGNRLAAREGAVDDPDAERRRPRRPAARAGCPTRSSAGACWWTIRPRCTGSSRPFRRLPSFRGSGVRRPRFTRTRVPGPGMTTESLFVAH